MSAPWHVSRANLAEPRLGAEVVFASDDFFAAKERLIDPAEPQFIDGKYDEHGKWMDGWESRRRRDGGHDWCVVRLGQPARIEALEIDTRFFTGNYPPHAAVEALHSHAQVPDESAIWTTIVQRVALDGDSRLSVEITASGPWTHLRLHIYPDGGVARLRVFGHFCPRLSPADGLIDVAALEHGGAVLACNDEHYGKLANIIAPGRGVNMGDGWETRRRREPGHDWGIIRLGCPATIQEVVIDTAFFKGNYPDRCSLQAIAASDAPVAELVEGSHDWPVLLPEQKMHADSEHRFGTPLAVHQPVSLVRVNLIPDGGISRLRLFGVPAGALR